MYAWIWRHLPGPPPVRALAALVILLAVVLLLFEVVFPLVEARLPSSGVSVG